MKAKIIRTVTESDRQAFVNTLTTVINQCDRMTSRAKGQGGSTAPRDEFCEMSDRLEKAANSFLGEKRRIWESRQAFLNRLVSICADPQQVQATMQRHGIHFKV